MGQWSGSRCRREGSSHTATAALGISHLGQYLPGTSALGTVDGCGEGYLGYILWNEGPLLESPVLQGRTQISSRGCPELRERSQESGAKHSWVPLRPPPPKDALVGTGLRAALAHNGADWLDPELDPNPTDSRRPTQSASFSLCGSPRETIAATAPPHPFCIPTMAALTATGTFRGQACPKHVIYLWIVGFFLPRSPGWPSRSLPTVQAQR